MLFVRAVGCTAVRGLQHVVVHHKHLLNGMSHLVLLLLLLGVNMPTHRCHIRPYDQHRIAVTCQQAYCMAGCSCTSTVNSAGMCAGHWPTTKAAASPWRQYYCCITLQIRALCKAQSLNAATALSGTFMACTGTVPWWWPPLWGKLGMSTPHASQFAFNAKASS